jgi:hypothetical protein
LQSAFELVDAQHTHFNFEPQQFVVCDVVPAGTDKQLIQDMRQLLIRNWVDLETWGKYALQLSIDGHGSADRLARQYLQGSSVVVKVASPFKDA